MASWKLWEPRRPVCGVIRMNERMEELRRRLGAIKQRLKVASAGDSFKFQPFPKSRNRFSHVGPDIAGQELRRDHSGRSDPIR